MSEVDWHCEMLADRNRVGDFGRAVREAVRPGDVVLDLGTGSGLLAFIASRAGASRVYALDKEHILDVARQLARDNGFGEEIAFIQGRSTQVELPEPVDLVVAEIIGGFGLEEKILESLSDARSRFLKPGGRLLPDRLDLYLAPTEEEKTSRDWPREIREDWELDFTALEEMSQHVRQGLISDVDMFLGQKVRVASFDLYRAGSKGVKGEVQVEIERAGKLTGWVGWFEAWFEGRPIISTEPPNRYPSWRNIFFPIGEPVPVEPGNTARLEMRLDNPLWSWRFSLDDPPVEREMGDFFSSPASEFKPPEKKEEVDRS